MQWRAIASLHRRIKEALSPLTGPALELSQLRAAAATYLATTEGEAAHELSLISQMLASPKVLIADPIASEPAPLLVALLLDVEELITAAQDAGALDQGPARARAVQLWAALQGAVSLGMLEQFDSALFSSQSIGEGLLENLLLSWGAAQSHSEQG